MSIRRASVDDGLEMTQLHATQPDRLDHLLARAVRMLDGGLGTIANPDPEQAPARTRQVIRTRTRVATGEYVADAAAVADAILERLQPAERAGARHLRAA
jgi:hypothetical protein